jgi:hypothetical protein
VAHHLRADLDQFFLQARQRPVFDRLRRRAFASVNAVQATSALLRFRSVEQAPQPAIRHYSLMDDGPGLFSDASDTWERYLSELKKLPDTVTNKQSLIESAERKIALKKRHGV